MKTLKELINTEEPGWDLVQEWLQEATNPYEILPRDIKRAEEELVRAQVTTRSPMGAIIYETGGILIDGGWIRILGSGCERLQRGIMEWNKGNRLIIMANNLVSSSLPTMCSEGISLLMVAGSVKKV